MSRDHATKMLIRAAILRRRALRMMGISTVYAMLPVYRTLSL